MADDAAKAAGTADTIDASAPGAPVAPSAELRPGLVVAQQYEIERVLGAGGMGTVYLARDRSLDRPVALKLHRAATQSERLRREAIAMAKLSHPNVVVVYEVGELDGHPFVVMEYVPGETLRAWAKERSWREVLRALIAAGEGLAAVHASGLVHRDIKPDNILVGRDGRVRLGDFGLAALPLTSPAPEETSDLDLTATGMIVGTPAYMSPEQLEGAAVDARTDQFAFCIAAWELLAGVRPFPGDTLERLRGAIHSGEIQDGERRIPANVRRVLARGLAADPAARYRDMPALLGALRSAMRRGRVIAASALGGMVIAGAIVWLAWPARDPLAACSSAGAEIDQILPAQLVTDTARSLQTTPGDDHGDGLVRASEDLRGAYRKFSREACVAETRGQWSHELARAARECRTYHAQTAREMIATAVTSQLGAADAIQIASALPDLLACGDARLLAGWQPLASDPAQLAAIVEARARLDAAVLLFDLSRISHLRKTIATVAASPVAKEPAVAGRLELVRALADWAEAQYPAAEKRLGEVYLASRAREDGELALRAVGYLIDLAVEIRRDPQAAARWTGDGLAEAERSATRWPEAAASVYLRAASAANEAGDPEKALELADRAVKLLPGARGSSQSAILSLRAEASLMVGKLDDALSANGKALALKREMLGDAHPSVADLLVQRANMLLEAGRGAEANDAIREAIAILGKDPVASATLASVQANLGAILTQLEDPRAQEILEQARSTWVKAYGEDHLDVAGIDINLALLANDHGEHDKAITLLSHTVRVYENVLGPDHVDLAPALYNLAVTQRDAGKLDDARASARRCAEIYGKRQPTSTRHMSSLTLVAQIERMRGELEGALASGEAALAVAGEPGDFDARAWARAEVARALIGQHRDPARARKLLGEARQLYEQAQLPKRVAEIDQLLRDLR